MKEFVVRLVGADESPGKVFAIGLAETAEPDGWDSCEHLHLQAPDEEEDNQPCLVTNEGTTYAPVLSWSLADRVLVLRLSEEAAAELGVEGGFRLDLRELDPDSVEVLEKGVARALVGVPRELKAR